MFIRKIDAELTAYQLKPVFRDVVPDYLSLVPTDYMSNLSLSHHTERRPDGTVITDDSLTMTFDRAGIERERTARYNKQKDVEIAAINQKKSFLDDPIGWMMGK